MQQPPCNGVDFTISFRFRLSENADTYLFGGWSNNLEWTSNRSKAPPKWCLFSIPPPSQDYSFPFGLDREGLQVGILKGCHVLRLYSSSCKPLCVLVKSVIKNEDLIDSGENN